MLAIKLSKTGKTNKKVFRLIISEKGRDPFGKVLETLGSYNPYNKELEAKADRIKHWISQGAQMTNTVNNLLISKGIIEGNKVAASKAGKKSEKRASQLKVKSDKKAAATEATKTPVVAEVTEAPAEVVTEETTPEVETQA